MDVQALGAWGEFVGGVGAVMAAVGVIITLLYLARQVRQNTKSARSSAYAAFMQGNAAVHQTHMAAVDILPAYLNDRADEWGLDSSSSDYMKFHGHATQVFMNLEMAFLLHNDGTVDDEYFDARTRLLAHALELPGLLRWWKENANYFYDARFFAYGNRIIAELDAAHPSQE